jgi:phytoene/squalene synthetase
MLPEMEIYHDISFKTSKLITKSYSTSFSLAVGLLSPETRQAIYSIYGFVRVADEIVDTFHGYNQKILLKNFENDCLEAIASGISMNPVLHSFAITVKKYNIPIHFIDSFLLSMKTDLSKHVYENTSELNTYIYGSADVVGLMCIKAFVNGDEKLYNELEKPAMKLGSAFQKVNFLRDLKADVEQLDRKYFPDFDIHSFDEKTKNALVKNIEEDFREAHEGVKRLPGRSKLAVLVAFDFYLELLRKIRNTPANEIVKTRIRISDPMKIWLLGKAWMKYKLKLI